MNYEQKYKESLKVIESLYNIVKYQSSNDALLTSQTIEKAFPELKESKNEKIRKDIIWCLKNSGIKESAPINPHVTTTVKDAISWLEKRGEQKPYDTKPHQGDKDNPYDMSFEEAQEYISKRGFDIPWNDCDVFVDERYITQTVGNILRWADENHIKKPVDKVEPKFKVGDFIINEYGFIMQIDGIDGNMYVYHVLDNNHLLKHDITKTEESCHLWTIQDAKNGDVVAIDDETIVIFKDLYNSTTFHSYCHIEEGAFNVSQDDMPDWWEGKGFHPATKEQRDLLFQKMKEEGYEWDNRN